MRSATWWSVAGLLTACALAALALGERHLATGHDDPQGDHMFKGPRAPELEPNLGWLNTDRALRFDGDLRGRVVLLDFWTYCCINCIHVLDEIEELEHTFVGEPFVVIGVHSAKFENEQDRRNIRTAIQRYEMAHPVVVDKDMAIWSRYTARGWPTLVLVGSDGRIIGTTSGEGNKDLLEGAIRTAIDEGRRNGTLAEGPPTIRLDAAVPSASGLRFPGKVLGDPERGRLFIADSGRHRVIESEWPRDGGHAMVRRVFGGPDSGFADGPAEAARFYEPQGLALSADGAVLYVADRRNHSIRALDLASGAVTTIAGTGEQGRDRRGGRRASSQALNSPWDLAVDGESLFIAMAGPHQIWMMDLTKGTIAAYAGSGIENIVDGDIETAALAQPSGLALRGRTLYFADSEVSAVRFVDLSAGQVKTIVGKGLFEFGDRDGDAHDARLQHPLGVTVWGDSLLVADTYNHKIRRIDPAGLKVQSWLGGGTNGLALYEPGGLHVSGEGVDARLFIADTNNHRIVMVDPASRGWVEVALDGLDGEALGADERFDEDLRTSIEVGASSAITLIIDAPLPQGAKVNADAPVSVRVEREGLTIAQRTVRDGKFPVEVTIPSEAVGEGVWSVVARFAYCTDDDRGLCAPRAARWTVDVATRAGAPARVGLHGGGGKP